MSHNSVRYTICSWLSWHCHILGFSPSTMAAICQALLSVFLSPFDLKIFDFIEIIPDILSLVILFSAMDLNLSLCQYFLSNLYLLNHITNLLHNISIWISHSPLKLNRLKSEILIILISQFYHKLPLSWWYQKTSMAPPCPYKHQVLCVLLTQTSSIQLYFSISTVITLAKLLSSFHRATAWSPTFLLLIFHHLFFKKK